MNGPTRPTRPARARPQAPRAQATTLQATTLQAIRGARPHGTRRLPAALLAAVALLAMVPAAGAQTCGEPGMNGQCTEFGSIAMESQRDVRGEPIDLTVSFTLNTAYAEQGSRWLLVSVRNAEEDGRDPVTIEMLRFASVHGDILTTRVEQPSASELNIWVETLDTPVGTPVSLDLRVGATERGAFQLETLVMAFDRGYAPVQDSVGNDASLFSFTLLGVNEETQAVASDRGSLLRGNKVPGPEASLLVITLVALALLLRRKGP